MRQLFDWAERIGVKAVLCYACRLIDVRHCAIDCIQEPKPRLCVLTQGEPELVFLCIAVSRLEHIR